MQYYVTAFTNIKGDYYNSYELQIHKAIVYDDHYTLVSLAR